ncbi:MAG: PhzF family phenazine biosynthesis protein [Calditrichota bacterium]|jgi:PhzF family phenazine biosynthesis protein
MELPLYQVDAFTNKVFGGNPAAVCPMDKWLDDKILQSIAAENNLSETAFFVKNKNEYQLRWFTPKIEVDLCGHATLASAYVIFNYINPQLNKIIFQTQSGHLSVEMENDLISMDFPSRKPVPVDTPAQLVKGLGIKPIKVTKSRDYFAIFDNEDQIKKINPDFAELNKLDSLGVGITAPGREVDFVSRFFAPKVGIPEDPVTGSAHSSLIPYWAERLNKNTLSALQLSNRIGILLCQNKVDRVIIAGKAVTYAIGKIYI